MDVFKKTRLMTVAEQVRIVLEYADGVERISPHYQVEERDPQSPSANTWIVERKLHNGAMSIFQYRVPTSAARASRNPLANFRWRVVWKGEVVFDVDTSLSSWHVFMRGRWRWHLRQLYADTIALDPDA